MTLICRYSGVKAQLTYNEKYQNSMSIAADLLLKSLFLIKKLKLHEKKSDITNRYYLSSMPSIFNEVWNIGSKRPLRKGRKANYALVTREEKEASDQSSPYAKASKTPQK
jgi:hypothetical protein